MDRFVVRGAKKLVGLTKTMIRLAEESETTYTKPRPLPLVKLLANVDVETVISAKEHGEELASVADHRSIGSVSSTVLQLMDIIEGVKHKFEPQEYFALVKDKELGDIGKRVSEGEDVNILLMADKCRKGINLYIGPDPPEGAIHYGRVPTNLAHYIAYALDSHVLSENLKLVNTNIVLGHRTLILNAICHAIMHYGAR